MHAAWQQHRAPPPPPPALMPCHSCGPPAGCPAVPSPAPLQPDRWPWPAATKRAALPCPRRPSAAWHSAPACWTRSSTASSSPSSYKRATPSTSAAPPAVTSSRSGRSAAMARPRASPSMRTTGTAATLQATWCLARVGANLSHPAATPVAGGLGRYHAQLAPRVHGRMRSCGRSHSLPLPALAVRGRVPG
jgi:hypothetical protein